MLYRHARLPGFEKPVCVALCADRPAHEGFAKSPSAGRSAAGYSGGFFKTRLLLACLLLMMGIGMGIGAWAQGLPVQILPSEWERQEGEKETLSGTFPGVLLIPRETTPAIDAKYHQPYRAVCGVYAAERASGKIIAYTRKFRVYAPDREALPTVKRVARLLLLLHGEERERMRFDHPRSLPTVDVWLTAKPGAGLSADVGGEQFKNQIYIYDLFAERRPIEWAREVAHEYGHYALPGLSGFTAPEAWGNGVLGERLHLKWLWEDLRAGRLKPDEIPFVTPEQLEDFLSKQVTPLLARIARNGVDTRQAARRDAEGMDFFTAVALYVDSVYGSVALLQAFAYSTPSKEGAFLQTPDFVRGVYEALRQADTLTITPPMSEKEAGDGFCVYLPGGLYTVTKEKMAAYRFRSHGKATVMQTEATLRVPASNWFPLTVIAPGSAARLILRRKAAE